MYYVGNCLHPLQQFQLSLNRGLDVLEHLPGLLIVAHLLVTLPLQISRNEKLKVKPVQQQPTAQERTSITFVHKHWKECRKKTTGRPHPIMLYPIQLGMSLEGIKWKNHSSCCQDNSISFTHTDKHTHTSGGTVFKVKHYVSKLQTFRGCCLLPLFTCLKSVADF